MVEIAHAQRVARQHRPAHAPAAGAPDLGQPAEAQAGHVAGQRRQRGERRLVVGDAVVDLVAQQQQLVLGGDRDDALEQRTRIHRAGRIVGVDEVDLERGYVSWVSPIAKALIKAKVGDTVKIQTPAGPKEIDIVAVNYDKL